jgi:hypothetical protein
VGGAYEELIAAGILADDEDGRPELRAESARLVRRMRERLVHSIGLFPADDAVAVPAVALELGRALADLSEGAIAVVDAHGSWPCARSLVAGAAPDGTLLVTSRLDDNLALLTPRMFDVGAMLQLRSVVVELAATFTHLVVDLTGFDHMGEHPAAFDLLDGVVVVARGGQTKARQVRRWLREVPDGRSLGVLLTGL